MEFMKATSDSPVEVPGFIAPGLYSWWAAGVCVGAIVVAIAALLLFADVRVTEAFCGALATAILFLCWFDTRGRFRAGRMVASIVVAVIIYRILVHKPLRPPNKLVTAGIAAVLLFVYSLLGGLGMALGKVLQRNRGAGAMR